VTFIVAHDAVEVKCFVEAEAVIGGEKTLLGQWGRDNSKWCAGCGGELGIRWGNHWSPGGKVVWKMVLRPGLEFSTNIES
jgi:hypothetical protein